MKTLINKLFAVLICTFSFANGHAFAQEVSYELETKTLPVSEFTSFSVEDDFEVSLVKGPQNVKLTAYRDLMPYVQVYVRGKVLFITYDERSVPKDVKKLYKGGKGGTEPIFQVTISLSELNGVTLGNNAVLTASDEFVGNRFEMTLGDKTQVKNLNLRVSTATLNMKKNAQAVMTVVADKKLEVNTDGNANLKLTANAPEMQLNAAGSSDWALVATADETVELSTAGSSELIVSVKTKKMVLQTAGSSKMTFSGDADSLEIKGEKSSQVEAKGLAVKTVDANLSGNARVDVSVSKSIQATLVGGSSLYYTGSPSIQIGKIIKSTLAPSGSK
jgi:hypothetical protein